MLIKTYFLKKKHLEVTNDPLEHKGLEGKIVRLFGTHFNVYLSPEGVIELLGRLLIVSEHQENMAKCTTSAFVAVNSKHAWVGA